MKISQIKINGVRGFSHQLDSNTNTETPHQINIASNSSFILFGENGTGKSSFFDALEWALTGEIAEESKQRRIETKEFIKNIHSTNNPKVSISFHNSQGEFTRELGLLKQLKFEHESVAQYHFIESNRITVFVTDTRNNLWRRFLELIGLDELLEFQTQLSYAKTIIQDEASSQKTTLDDKIKQKQSFTSKNDNLAEKLTTKFGESWKNKTITDETQTNLDKSQTIKAIIDSITSYIDLYNEVEGFKNSYADLKVKLEVAKQQISFSNIAQLLEQAENYFKQNPAIVNCPVCNENTITKTVIDNITTQKDNVNSVLNLEEQITNLSATLKSKNPELNQKLQSTIQKFNKQYNKNIVFDNNSKLAYDYLNAELPKVEDDYKRLKESISIQIDNEFKTYHDNCKNIDKLDTEIALIEEDFLLKDEILKDYEIVATNYKNSYDELLEEELQDISETYVTDIYNQLNQTDNEIIDNFKIEHDITKQEIKFSATLKNSETLIDPITMLSTGHLRCLGFSLLMARVKKKNSALKFIAIDDPIYAIDHEHRYSLINYLCNEAKNYQFIITTSDRNFYDIFRNKIGKQSLTSYKTQLQTSQIPHSVLLKESPKNYLEEAKIHLYSNDYRASALYARIALEHCLFDLAEKKKFKKNLEIGKRLNISLDDIFSIVLDGLKREYTENTSRIDKEFTCITNNPYFKSLLTNTPLNREIHQTNEFTGFLNTKAEIEEIINITDTFKSYILELTAKIQT